MATYATEAEFLALSLPAEAFSTLPAGTISVALGWASQLADGYLKKRYTLPLPSFGTDLTAAVCDLASLRLLRYRGFKPASGASTAIVAAADEAKAWLLSVSLGDIELANASDMVPNVPAVAAAAPQSSSAKAANFDYFVSAAGQIAGRDPFGEEWGGYPR